MKMIIGDYCVSILYMLSYCTPSLCFLLNLLCWFIYVIKSPLLAYFVPIPLNESQFRRIITKILLTLTLCLSGLPSFLWRTHTKWSPSIPVRIFLCRLTSLGRLTLSSSRNLFSPLSSSWAPVALTRLELTPTRTLS